MKEDPLVRAGKKVEQGVQSFLGIMTLLIVVLGIFFFIVGIIMSVVK